MIIPTLAIALVLQGIGAIAVLYSLAPTRRLTWTAVGTGLIYAGSFVNGGAPSLPDPSPRPGPVVPVGEFAERVNKSFTGTKAEAQVVAGLHRGMAKGLAYDGSLPKPIVSNTNQMGAVFARLQQYYHGSTSPYGNKFAAFEKVCRDEALSRGIIGTTNQQMDADRRNKAVNFLSEIAHALSTK